MVEGKLDRKIENKDVLTEKRVLIKTIQNRKGKMIG